MKAVSDHINDLLRKRVELATRGNALIAMPLNDERTCDAAEAEEFAAICDNIELLNTSIALFTRWQRLESATD